MKKNIKKLQEVEVTIISKQNKQYSKEIKVQLQLDTTFAQIIKFLIDNNLINNQKSRLKLQPNDQETIANSMRIKDFANLTQLRFYIYQPPDLKIKSKNKIRHESQNLLPTVAQRKLAFEQKEWKSDPSCCTKQNCNMF